MFQEHKKDSRIFGQGNFQALLIQMIVDKKGQAFATLSAVCAFTELHYSLVSHCVYIHTQSKKTVHAVTGSDFWISALVNSRASPTFLPSVYLY